MKVELRPWTLNLNLDELHKNRELPAAYLCWLGVCDSSLPTKGTAHRNVRGNPDSEHDVNKSLHLCMSKKKFLSFLFYFSSFALQNPIQLKINHLLKLKSIEVL